MNMHATLYTAPYLECIPLSPLYNYVICNILMVASPPAMATFSLSGEKSAVNTPRDRPVIVPTT